MNEYARGHSPRKFESNHLINRQSIESDEHPASVQTTADAVYFAILNLIVPWDCHPKPSLGIAKNWNYCPRIQAQIWSVIESDALVTLDSIVTGGVPIREQNRERYAHTDRPKLKIAKPKKANEVKIREQLKRMNSLSGHW